MSITTIGSGIVSAPVEIVEKFEAPAEPAEPAPVEIVEKFEAPTEPAPVNPFEKVEAPAVDRLDLESIKDSIRAEMRGEFAAAVADVERRLGQARELERSANGMSAMPRSVHAEDLNINRHIIDGYLLTANSPTTGSIAWSSLHVVLLGVDYTIADGNTANKYAWFIKPASGTTATLLTGNTLPTLSNVDALIFVNNGGVPISALETSISYAVGPGVIGNSQLAQDVQTTISTLQANDIALQSAVDGTIITYYQNDPPWPSGSPSPSGGNINQGDIWYDSNDNGAFRWTGTSGSPANTWQRIADTDNSALASKINTKTATYIATTAPTVPTPPETAFTVGDLWLDTDGGNLISRWNGTAWIALQLGDAAISGVGGAKIGSGINAANVTTGVLAGTLVGTGVSATNITTGTLGGALVGTGINATNVTTGTLGGARVGTGINASNIDNGTLLAARVGAGVAGAALGSATGQVGSSQIATNSVTNVQIASNTVLNANLANNAVTPAKINAAFHLLY